MKGYDGEHKWLAKVKVNQVSLSITRDIIITNNNN